ncbi:hypothetical protein [Flavobacterium sp.]|jgi:hypothetical protein|uniref:hypothetical protein n=1 Tax=Flavobacterium sp. TaxID=239 RepID=UPI0037C08916
MSIKNIWNNGINIETIEKKWLILLVLPFLLVIAIEIQKSTTIDFEKEFYLRHTEDEFQGIVQRKWFFRRNVYIKLIDSTEIIGYYSIYKKVSKGDSIIKKKNSKEIIVIKKDSIIYNDIYDENKFRFKLR